MSTNMERELEAAMGLDTNTYDQAKSQAKPEVDQGFAIDHIAEMTDLGSLAQVYMQDLKTLQAARADMVKKAHWVENTIKLLDRRIEINLNAIKTLQTPHERPKTNHKIIDNDD